MIIITPRLWGRGAAAGTLLGLGALAVLLLLAADGGRGGEAGEGGRTELFVRSANLVVKDLAQAWDEQHYRESPSP
jgi:hypothetical protein